MPKDAVQMDAQARFLICNKVLKHKLNVHSASLLKDLCAQTLFSNSRPVSDISSEHSSTSADDIIVTKILQATPNSSQIKSQDQDAPPSTIPLDPDKRTFLIAYSPDR